MVPGAATDGGSPLATDSPVRFDLSGEDRKLAESNRRFGKMAAIFWVVFIALGFLFAIGNGYPPFGKGLPGVVIFSAMGSILFWMWLAFSLQRPLADIIIGQSGISGHNTRGTEFRVAWADANLRITLSHELSEETSPFRTPETDWRLSIRPTSVSGELPENCYEYLVDSARRFGLFVADRKYYQSTKNSGYWMVETVIRPKNAPP